MRVSGPAVAADRASQLGNDRPRTLIRRIAFKAIFRIPSENVTHATIGERKPRNCDPSHGEVWEDQQRATETHGATRQMAGSHIIPIHRWINHISEIAKANASPYEASVGS